MTDKLWIARSRDGWSVYEYTGKHIMTHGYLCSAQGVPLARNQEYTIISNRSPIEDIEEYNRATKR